MAGYWIILRNGFSLAGMILLILFGCISCDRKPTVAKEEGLARVGSIVITETDLDYALGDKYSGRKDETTRNRALQELVERARYAQAALDAGFVDDPVIRSEMGRLLKSRMIEDQLAPLLKGIPEPTDDRLRKIYAEEKSRFQSAEKRRVAVLWLNPGQNPARLKAYEEKMAEARQWILDHAETMPSSQGFGTLSVDFSEHQASRFKGGVVGWMEQGGRMDAWSKPVAELAFSLQRSGEVSEVIARPEGLFLVRLMDLKPAIDVPFEDVRKTLAREERDRLVLEVKTVFEEQLLKRYPVE